MGSLDLLDVIDCHHDASHLLQVRSRPAACRRLTHTTQQPMIILARRNWLLAFPTQFPLSSRPSWTWAMTGPALRTNSHAVPIGVLDCGDNFADSLVLRGNVDKKILVDEPAERFGEHTASAQRTQNVHYCRCYTSSCSNAPNSSPFHHDQP